MKKFLHLANKNKVALGIFLISVLIIGGFAVSKIQTIQTSNKQSFSANKTGQNFSPYVDPEKKALEEKFNYLSSHGNSSCSGDFYNSIPQMSDNQRLQGSCCSPMVLSKYEEQIEGIKKYKDIPQIPSDPYDIPAKLAKELLNYAKTITPTADEQIILDKAVADSPEKGYCCCKCWRWYVYEGLSKYLVRNQHFTSQQITDVLANSDGCGGSD